jgi:hypothetical protein
MSDDTAETAPKFDLSQLPPGFLEAITAQVRAEMPAVPENHGEPDPANSLEGAPFYYVHLANGDVMESQDSASTHVDVDGVSVAVIGRYLKGE